MDDAKKHYRNKAALITLAGVLALAVLWKLFTLGLLNPSRWNN